MLVISEAADNITCEALSEKLGLPVIMITRGILDDYETTGVLIRIKGTEADITLERQQFLKEVFYGQKIVIEFVT